MAFLAFLFRRPAPAPSPIVLPPLPVPAGATLLALVSESSRVRHSELAAAAPVLEAYLALVRQRWSDAPALAVRPYLAASLVPAGAWVAHITDSVPHGDLGFHDVHPKTGLPRIRVKPAGGWFTTLSHEAAETNANPWIADNNITFRGQGIAVMREICDPVSDRTFTFQGRKVADFVFPSWFQANGKPPYNQRNTLRAPATLDGGYVTLATGGTVN